MVQSQHISKRSLRSRDLVPDIYLSRANVLREKDGETGEVVGGVGLQGEGATMSGENVAYEQETDALTLWLSRKEGSEEMLSCFGGDATSVVGDREGRLSPRPPCREGA